MRVLIAASTNGGAEAVAPVAKSLLTKGHPVHVLASHASSRTFSSMGVEHEHIEGGSRFLPTFRLRVINAVNSFKPDAILIGTQIQDQSYPLPLDYVLTFHERSKKRGRVPVVAVLDTWGNYLERFSDLDLTSPKPHKVARPLAYLPDLIAVPDGFAKSEMVRLGFPEKRLAVTGNPYFEHVVNEFSKFPPATRAMLLARPVFSGFHPNAKLVVFMSDNIEGAYPEIGFTERSVLESFLKSVDTLSMEVPINVNVIVRPHPFRNENAAAAFAAYMPTHTRAILHNPVSANGSDPANNYSMEELLTSADLVVGTFNNPLVTAKLAGKPVINYLPGLSDPKYNVQAFMNERGLSALATDEASLTDTMYCILSGVIIQGAMENVAGATDSVVRAVHSLNFDKKKIPSA